MKRYLCLFFLFTRSASFAQYTNNNTSLPPVNWQLLDWQKDGYPGMSVEKAYTKLLNHKNR